MEDVEILNIFLKSNLNLHPNTLEVIKKRSNVDEAIKKILVVTKKKENCPEVITPEYLEELEGDTETFKKNVSISPKRKKIKLAEEYNSELYINKDKDITGKSNSGGDIGDFLNHFTYRYDKLSKILKNRIQITHVSTIEHAKKIETKKDVQIIGMVNDKRTSKKGNIILNIEDYSGTILVIILKKDKNLMQISKEIVLDEVIAIIGKTVKKGDIIIANDLVFPDLPNNREPNYSLDPLSMAIISDIHVGSSKFIEMAFEKFIKWIKGDLGNAKQKAIADRVKYLLIGGDLVDGVGIYPGQEKELKIKDIQEQYKKFYSYIQNVPSHIEIIILPGNHDAVRRAEPQPSISEEFALQLNEDPRVHMVGNPATLNIHGVNVLSYHGRSMDDIIAAVEHLSYSKPEKAMETIIKKRHLTPTFGRRVPIVAESIDYMLIDEVPDIFQLGHVHTVGVDNYRGTNLISSGTFQEQTSFQRKHNVTPDPGRIPIVNLMNHRTTLLRFI
tara:strand:- start:3614 stop:5116 length:1503 start_codon:yes stop_codon:yes gene_type:complete